MKNFSFKENPITTGGAALFMLLSIFMFLLPVVPGVQIPKSYTEHWYVPYIPAVFAVILARSPDSIVTGAKKIASKITDQKGGKDE